MLLLQLNQELKDGAHLSSKLYLVDLAGSERAAATEGKDDAMKAEGRKINASLSALGLCIHELAHGGKHISYRNSKLTNLLQARRYTSLHIVTHRHASLHIVTHRYSTNCGSRATTWLPLAS